ncbi:MAG: phage holin family protein [Pseudolabrys sp.]
MQSVFRHLRILWRAERVIAETRLRVLLRRSMLYGFAGLVALFGLGMLNVAAYLFLARHWGPEWAAAATALGDFVIALAVLLIALAIRPGPELPAAVELRDMSMQELEAELAPLQDRVAWLSRATRDPFETVLPTLLIPLITSIMRGLRKGKAE